MKGNIKLMKKLFNILLVLLLSMGIFTSNSVKVEAYDGSETDTTGWIQPWTHFGDGGNVEWAIDPEETLWIRPENGASTGTMGSISSTYLSRMPWYSKRSNITSVRIKSGTTVEALVNSNCMFYEVGKTGGVISLTELDTSNVTSMSSMFWGSQATALDVSNFDTSKVTNMSEMFYNSKATTLDVSSFDTSNVTNMWGMFRESQATTLDLSNFDTSNVTSMDGMFEGSQATALDLSSFDTSNVTSMSSMFGNSKATTLDLSNFDTSSVTTMSSMFRDSQTTTLDLSSFDTSNVTTMYCMFRNSQATTLDVSSFDTSNVTNMGSMFNGSKATTLDLSNFDTSKVTNMKYMFEESQATSLDLSSFDTSNGTDMYCMFSGCQAILMRFSNNMNGDNGEGFKVSYLSGNDWVKVRDKNGNLTYDDTQFTGRQVRNLTESTTPSLSGTWVKKSSPEYQAEIDKGQEYISKQGVNANNEWVKNGDTWTYTFDVFDDSIPYYIWEDRIPGYTSSVMKPDKDLMNQNGEKYYEIINRSTTLGSLNITKTTNAETDDRFEFTITLEGNGLEGTKVFSNVIFTDGAGRIKLGKDESKIIEGLPAGVTYTVEETAYGDYITTSTGETGTIVQGEIQEVSFHNEKVPVKNLTAESGFKVKKVVEGNNEVAEAFDFIAQINAGEPNKLINLSNGESITTDASGLAIYEFSLANNEELIFSNLSTGASYQVTEKAGEYISSYSIQDLNEGNSINQSANENTIQNLALSTAVETLDVDEEIEITFINKIIKKQNLKVAKQVNGNAEDKANQYEITVELYGLDPMATLDSDAGRFVADEDGYAIKTILLRDGEEFMIPEVPVGTQYVITESPNNTYAAYEITDVNGGSKFAKKVDSNNDINLRLATQMETVNENEEATVKFINTSQVTLKLEKVVDGNMGNKEDEFEFDVKVMMENQNKMINHNSFTSSSIQNYLSHYVGTENNLINYSGEYLSAIIQDNKAIVLQSNNNGTIVQLSEQDAANTYAEIAADYASSISIEEVSTNFNNYNEFIEIYNDLYAEIDNLVGSSAAPHNYIKMRYNEQKNRIIVQVPFGEMFVGNNVHDYFVYNVVTTNVLDYIDLSQYGGISNGDGSYRFTLKHGDNLEIAKVFPGYNYEITEVDYSNEGYRTYPNNSMIQGKTISGILNENTDVKMRNIRGGAVPTEIRFYIPIGIPALIGMVGLFIVKQRRKEVA